MHLYFDFLNDLRKSGNINMFGATHVLQEVFDIDKYEARKILNAWIKSFEVNANDN